MPRDISGLKKGNVGVDFVHRFDSGRPGPKVHVNALTHGNEFCGMTALTWLIEQGVRPTRGTLTLSFANVAAYASFDPQRPLDSRFIDRDFNRVWRDEILESDDQSVEVRRARELQPVLTAADALLDMHSTTFTVSPMLVYQLLAKSERLAAAMREPLVHIVSHGGKHDGGILIEFGKFGDPARPEAAILVECGQHFAKSSGRVAINTMLRFLRHYDVVDRDFVAAHLEPPLAGAPKIYEISQVLSCKRDGAYFARALEGFEEFAAGDLIGHDGEVEIRAPYDRCAVIMPKVFLVPGREMVTLAQRR